MEVVVTECLSDDAVLDKFYAVATQRFDFLVDDGVGKTEFGNAVFQHASDLVQCLENRDGIAVARHFARERQAAWA